jgi:hypothetical protein
MINILITSGGGIWIPKLAKLLYKDFNIFLTDVRKVQKPKFVKKIFKINFPKSKNYVSDLSSICNKNYIDLVLPSSDEEAILLSKKKKSFQKKTNAKLLVSEYSIMKNFESKDKIYNILAKKKINTFLWKLVKNKTQLNQTIQIFRNKDFVIKPAKSRGGRNTFIFKKNIKTMYSKNNGREKFLPHEEKKIHLFMKKTKFNFPLIVMDCLYGPIYDIDILAYRGKLIQFATRERIGFQGIRGNIIKKYNNRYLKISKKTSKILKLSWLFDFDVMHDKKGLPQILEINPRQSGSIFNSLRSNFPFYKSIVNLIYNLNMPLMFKLKKDKKYLN